MFGGPYVVINQIIKVHIKFFPFKKLFIIHVRQKNINPIKKNQDWDF
jgi:hypothetical protein